MTFAAVCVYLYETTLDAGRNDSGGDNSWTRKTGLYPAWYAPVEDCFLIFFVFDVLVGAVMADHDWGYWVATVGLLLFLCRVRESVCPAFFPSFDLI